MSGTVFAETKQKAETQVTNMGYRDAVVFDPLVGNPAATAEIEKVRPTPEKEPQSALLQSMIVGMNKAVKEQLDSSMEAPIRRQQTIFMGTEPIRHDIQELLDKHHGEVTIVQMRPGHDGRMMYVIVVEHNVREKKK